MREREREYESKYLIIVKHSVATFQHAGLLNPEHLCQSSDWPAHGLIRNANESHGDLFHTHLYGGVTGPIGATLSMKTKQNMAQMIQMITEMWNSASCPRMSQCLWLVRRQEEVDLLGQVMKMLHGLLQGQWFILPRAKDLWEEGGEEATQG